MDSCRILSSFEGELSLVGYVASCDGFLFSTGSKSISKSVPSSFSLWTTFTSKDFEGLISFSGIVKNVVHSSLEGSNCSIELRKIFPANTKLMVQLFDF